MWGTGWGNWILGFLMMVLFWGWPRRARGPRLARMGREPTP